MLYSLNNSIMIVITSAGFKKGLCTFETLKIKYCCSQLFNP